LAKIDKSLQNLGPQENGLEALVFSL
jgi:hypothetical protein